MISYGSLIRIAEMLALKRSHQLGEGHRCGAEMPTWTYPPRPVLGLINFAAMLCRKRPILTRGHQNNAAMPFLSRLDQFQPEASPPTQQCQSPYASQGKGQLRIAAMLGKARPSPPVLGQSFIAEMPRRKRPILTRGQSTFTAMPCI